MRTAPIRHPSPERAPVPERPPSTADRGNAAPRRPKVAAHRVGAISFEPGGVPAPPRSPPLISATSGPPVIQGRFSWRDVVSAPRNIKDRFNLWRMSRRMATAEQQLQAQAPATADELGQHFQNLHGIEETAHTWLRDRNQHASDASRQRISGMLDRIQNQRRALVGAQLQGDHPLWLPDTVAAPEALRARGLWNSIRQSQGHLRLEHQGDADFRRDTLADMSKMLQSQHGRDMLDDLDANAAGHTTRIRANWDGQFDEDHRGPWARAENSQHAASPGVGQVGPGSNAFVQIEDPGGARDYLAGEHEEALPTSSYVTLAHELGHARRQVRGEAREGVMFDRPGEPNAHILRQLWNNPEEYENIRGQENPLRAELGLPRRRFHRSHRAVFLTRERAALQERYNRAADHLGGEEVPESERAMAWALGYPHPDVDWNGGDAAATVERARGSLSRFEWQVRRHRLGRWWERVRPRFGRRRAYQQVAHDD
ncbi:MAG: M91 family zinc metallopeptidase [Acidobacteriota bacterium]